MDRKGFIKLIGLGAFAFSITGFKLIELDDLITTDCASSTDMIGPFFRKGAPYRNNLTYPGNKDEVQLKVVGRILGADCRTPLKNIEIDIWHCDHKKDYDMDSDQFICRGKIKTNENGEYWFKTFIPPPYAGRPKHIHYLIKNVEGFQELATQLYFKGDKKIKNNNWVKYRWDERRILSTYNNEENLAEVKLDLYLTRQKN